MIPNEVLTEELLQQAVAELATTLNDSLPPHNECHHKFSGGFEEIYNLLSGVSQRITDNEITLAEKSKELRNVEFAELRKNNVIINIGDLRGQSLADVLMSDLMVNDAA